MERNRWSFPRFDPRRESWVAENIGHVGVGNDVDNAWHVGLCLFTHWQEAGLIHVELMRRRDSRRFALSVWLGGPHRELLVGDWFQLEDIA